MLNKGDNLDKANLGTILKVSKFKEFKWQLLYLEHFYYIFYLLSLGQFIELINR